MSQIVAGPDGATPLDPDELAGLKHPHIQTRGQLDELEQYNVQAGLKWLKRQKNADILSEQFVCQLHERLFGEVWNWAGKFRRSDKNIDCDAGQIAIQLRNLLDDSRYWVENTTYPAKELAARFHYRLVAIHPFANGNGRHSRIMADALLTLVMGELPIDWAGGRSLQEMGEHRKTYMAALRAADGHEYQPLLEFVGL
mgnify:CR=1 FL=1